MKKKKVNWFNKILIFLFVIFIGLFIASKSGYYETKVNKNVALTNEAIKQFEEDVLEGKQVDIESYVVDDDRDFSNGLTKAGDKLSSTVEELLSGGLLNVWDVIKILVG